MNQQGKLGMSARRGLAGIVMIGSLCAGVAQAQLLYRWTNEQGLPEVSNSIPPKEVEKGYEILDGSSMRVLKVVSPKMTEAEYQEAVRREKARAACEAALDRVLYLYQTAEDIDKAENAALKSIDGRIQNANENLKSFKSRLAVLEADAASQERQGENVEKGLLADISDANSQIASLEREIEQREAEKVNKHVEYDEERRMFAVGTCDDDVIARR